MKEISYNGPSFDKEEDDWAKKKTRSVGSTKAPTVRTFRADVEELIQEKGTTKTEIAMAEADRRERRGERRVLREEDDTHLGRIIFFLMLILAFGVGVGAYALIGTKLSIPFMETATTTAPIPVATTEDLGIIITDGPREQVLADISIAFGKTSLPTGQSRTINFLKKDASGVSRPATTAEFLSAVVLPQSSKEIIKSLNESFTFSVYSGTTLSGVFMVSSRYYANTFASALEWESTMGNDLIPVVNAWYDRAYVKETSKRHFKDERVGSFDIRALTDATGNIVLAYGFLNKKTLVIAGNREALLATLIAHSQDTTK
jgi:hypothetical protein